MFFYPVKIVRYSCGLTFLKCAEIHIFKVEPIFTPKMFIRKLSYFFSGLLIVSLSACNTQSAEQIADDNTKTDEAPVETVLTQASETEYVCPMRCEGSGQDEPGTCPVCNMLVVRSVEVEDFEGENRKYTRGSVYNLKSNWVTQNGDQIELESLSGDFQLACMIFTNCPEACPNLIGDMLTIDEALEPETKERLKYLLVTIDPDNDTPEQLAAYAKGHDLDTEQWTLLQGEKEKTRELSNLLGVEYKQYENGTFGHTNYLILLNEEGEIIYRLNGIHVPNEDLVAFMNKHI